MPLPTSTASALRAAGINLRDDISLAPRVYWKVGGPADGIADIPTTDALIAVQAIASEHDLPVFALGKGSNLLVSDAGIRGLVIRLTDDLATVRTLGGAPPRVVAGAGMPLVALLSASRKAKWAGLSCFAGIPGTVGGAVRMNAGSSLGETVTPLVSVDIVHRGGAVETLSVDQLRMAYRTSHIPPGSMIASAELQTTDEPFEPQHDVMVEFLQRRKATQPLRLPSCGSTFRNPPGDFAGRLIDSSGLKGFSIGGAQVSEMHANFIVNHGHATADDIRRVIDHVQYVVSTDHGVLLEREVHFVGDWS